MLGDNRTSMARTPDPDHFEIDEIEETNGHLVLKIKYPNLARCADCSFEGAKVMVILNCTVKQAIKWRHIDPHFKDLKTGVKLAATHSARRRPVFRRRRRAGSMRWPTREVSLPARRGRDPWEPTS